MSPHLRVISDQQSPAEAPRLSFEFFPPKNERMERCLWRNIGQLELLGPSFFSVTYGAGGSDRERSLKTLEHMQRECPVPLAAHLTCVGHSREEALEIAAQMHANGVRALVALRGDADPVAGGFDDVAEFVAELKDLADFDISVAAYPEVHPMAASAEADMAQLKRKLDAGANRAISQYFFDVDSFLRFRDSAVKAGIKQPLLPGILPTHNFENMVKFSKRCGTHIPADLFKLFEGTEGNTQVQHALAVDVAVDMCESLTAEGVHDLHFYTLNTPSLTFEITRQLGVPLAKVIASAA